MHACHRDLSLMFLCLYAAIKPSESAVFMRIIDPQTGIQLTMYFPEFIFPGPQPVQVRPEHLRVV